MSEYKDFVRDFAGRCRDVMEAYLEPARARDREVTLLLMTAASGFVISYERMRDSQGFSQPNLDRERYAGARNKLRAILDERILESRLTNSQESWRGGFLRSADGLPDEWPELRDPAHFDPNTPVSEVVLRMRHALAHGNVLTQSGPKGDISKLVFVSGGHGRVPLRFALVSPDDLASFLKSWFDTIRGLPLPYQEVLRAVDEAA